MTDATEFERERDEAERAFDARVAAALASAGPGDAEAASIATVRALLARTRPPAAAPVPAGRVHRFRFGIPKIAVAAAALVVSTMWWFCIPPFQCGYMQAIEKAACGTPGHPACPT